MLSSVLFLFARPAQLLRALPPAVSAAVAQIVATLLVACLVFFAVASFHLEMQLMLVAVLQGVIAAGLGRRLGLAPWWFAINLVFAPALVWFLSFSVPPVWFLAAFLVLLLIYWSTFKTQVPLYLSGNKAWRAVSALLPEHDGFRFVDLGSGLGGMVGYLARLRPGGRYIGIELAPLPYFLGWLRSRGVRNSELLWGDFWRIDLAQYDVVFAYLSPVPMPELWRKARAEMRPGSLFVSYTFPVPGVMPAQVVELDDAAHSRLYIWRM